MDENHAPWGCLAGLRAVLGLGNFPGHPQHPVSSLIWGFLAPMASAPQPEPLPLHGPGCFQAFPLQGGGCSWGLFLLTAPTLLFSPQLWLLLPPSHHLPQQPDWGSTLPSPPRPTGGYLQGHSSSPIPRQPLVPPGCPLCLTSPTRLFPPSFLQALPPPSRHLLHTAPDGGSSRSKISACAFLGWQSDKHKGTDPSLPVPSLRCTQGVLGTQPHGWRCSPRASIPLSHHLRQPPTAPAHHPPASHSL